MSVAKQLTALLSADRVSTRAADLELAAGDESACQPVRPDVGRLAAVYRGSQPCGRLCVDL